MDSEQPPTQSAMHVEPVDLACVSGEQALSTTSNNPFIPYATPSPRRTLWRVWLSVLLAVLFASALLVILANLTLSNIDDRTPAKTTITRGDISSLWSALDAFAVDNGRYPTTVEGLASLIQSSPSFVNWHGPYVPRIPIDPYGRPYLYTSPGVHNPTKFDLMSLGPDGKAGTQDDIANWP